MKYKNKEFKSVELKISENLDSQIYSLNKKYPRLAKLTEEYFSNESKADFDEVKEAFITKSDPSILMQKHKDFVEKYLEAVVDIRDKHAIEETDHNFNINVAIEDVKNLKQKLYNTVENIDKQYINTTKKEILEEIIQSNKTSATQEEILKRERLIRQKVNYLKAFMNDPHFIELDSVAKDLDYLKQLYRLTKEQKRPSK